MEQQGGERRLARYLTPFDVGALSLGCIIGWGAFVMPGTTFLPIAGPMGTMAAMGISALIMMIIGVNYAYLMQRFPGTGGVYAYTKAALGRGHAFLSAWFLCLSYLALIPQNATALAMMCRTVFGGVLQSGVHYRVAGYDMYLGEAAIAVTALVIVGVLAIRQKRLMQWLQTGFAALLLLGVGIIAIMAFPRIDLAALFSSDGFGLNNQSVAVLSIIVLAPWAFVGFEVISLETAHFRFPVKKSGGLIVISILLGSFIYAAMAVVAASVVPDGYASWQAYIADLGSIKGYATLPTFYAAGHLMGWPGLVVIGVTAVAAMLSSLIGFYRATVRILENMAEDHILTATFSNSRSCFVFIMLLSIGVSFLGRNALSWVMGLSSFGAIVGFGYTSVVARKTAKARGDRRSSVCGSVGIALSVVFALTQLLPKVSAIETMAAESYLLLALWCLLGFIFCWRTMKRNTSPDNSSETSVIAALFFLMFYAAMVWFVKKMLAASDGGSAQGSLLAYSGVFSALVVFGLLVMLMILSQLRKRQMELQSQAVRALETSRAKSQFLFNMSHDIRTPMNAIIGYTDLALKEDRRSEMKGYLRKINQSSQHLLALIDDVLEMSRIESGRIELKYAPVNLRSLVRAIGDVFTPQMKEKEMDFRVDADGLRNPDVLCDRKNLNRVLINVLSNAWKFTPAGGTIRLTAAQNGVDGEGLGLYELRVKDSGIGMSQQFVDRMFNAFERERTSTDSGVEGTGLGLAITRSIVDLMGGEIEVVTAPGSGTEIIIRLRLRLADADADPGEAPPEPFLEPQAVDFSGLRALLVEDNAINLEIATMILTQLGFAVEAAENGQVAVDRVKASEPGYYDCVLMDIQMPVMNGYEATRAIRQLEDKRLAGIPIVAMTANAFQEDVRAALDAGMQGHISKPIDVGVMTRTLREVLRKE